MRLSVSKVFVVIAMLVAFFGQSMAYTTMACEMNGQMAPSQLTMDHSAMNHQSMNHQSMNHADMDHADMAHTDRAHTNMSDDAPMQSHEDCCGDDCTCPASACTSVSLVNTLPLYAHLVLPGDDVMLPLANQTQSVASFLFRPPIFV